MEKLILTLKQRGSKLVLTTGEDPFWSLCFKEFHENYKGSAGSTHADKRARNFPPK